MQTYNTTNSGSLVSIESVLARLNKVRRSGDGYTACCPVPEHEDNNPSFFIKVGDEGKLLWKCLRGCPQIDTGRALGLLGNGEMKNIRYADPKPTPKTDPDWLKELIQKIWNEAKPMEAGDVAHSYITKTRQISLPSIPEALRFHSSLEYRERDENNKPILIGEFPAIVAKVQNLLGELIAVHRIYLTKDGRKISDQYPNLKAKLSLGKVFSGAVQLFQAGSSLCVAEGVETAAAMSQIFKQPAWAALGSNLRNVVIPDSVEHLIIGIDNDPHKAGEKSAAELFKRYEKTIARISIARAAKILDVPGADWADVIKLKGTN